ncbi:hypothetical protein QFC19_002773 [Naganishia cerealis]|uniref:Uncharacterized protein n=1 Tax=Naganishia cerealis TaxID=610337 RepID=A0ACC2WBA8_9TREE|nr:hypothetical protein QFC19_002773 [Naganishia cerealis]
MGLSDQLIDHAQTSNKADGGDSFSAAELKDLFTVQCKTNGCHTHDLLECDCLTRQEQGDDFADVASPNLLTVIDTLNKHEDEEDSEEEQAPAARFVSASQYDPAGVQPEGATSGQPPIAPHVATHELTQCVAVRQAAVAKQAKLAALRKWTHIDPNMEEVRLALEDKILNGLLTFDLASRQMSPVGKRPRADKGFRRDTASASASDLDTDDRRRPVEARTSDGDDVDSGDESDLAPKVEELLERLRRPRKVDAAVANDPAEESVLGSDDWPASDGENEDGGVPDSADEMDVSTTGHHERSTSSSRKDQQTLGSPGKGSDKGLLDEVDGDEDGVNDNGLNGKKYDLNDIARAGHAGKIMFIFQKVSTGNQIDKSA